MLRAVLDQLGEGFAGAVARGTTRPPESSSRASSLALFSGLLAGVYDGYYQDDRVREKIGVVRGPVFPRGNEVAQGDLSLLDPVIENADAYRYRAP